jgi:hypothetical protein
MTWLREAVSRRKALAEAATAGPWRSLIEGRDHWGGDSFVMTAGEDLYPHVVVGGKAYNPNWEADQDFIAANDPPGVIARCEAELAALDLCARVIREDAGRHEDCGDVDAWTGLAVARLSIGFIASGYRYREGYAGHWGASA